MTSQTSYNQQRQQQIAAASEKKKSERQKKQDILKERKKAAGFKAKADELYAKYKAEEAAIQKIEQLLLTETNPTNIANLKKNKEILTKQKNLYHGQWRAQKYFYEESLKKIEALKKKPTGSNLPAGNTVSFKNGKAIFPYQFNAPMVRGAYFNPTSISSRSINESDISINYAPYTDALTAWKDTKPARGALQMDREFTQLQINNIDPKNAKTQLDLQMYGFRFLYNPKEVNMGWSTQGFVDPEYVPQDEAIPISTNMTASYVTFSLVINRIEDMNFIDKFGFVSAQAKKFAETTEPPTGDLDPAQRNRIYNSRFIANSPYPETVPLDDLVEIYQKGTMYDLEYLFKTINGPAATFKNKYGVQTADRSYMRLAILELHLGNSMRYRGRITELEVNHTIFNNRMIPLFSTVRISFARINDAYVLPDKK